MALMMVPGFGALALVTGRRRWTDIGLALQVAVVLATSGALSWLVFFLWAARPALGPIVAFSLYGVGVIMLVSSSPKVRRRLCPVVIVFAVAVGTSIAMNGLVFVHGGYPVAREVAATATAGTADNAFPNEWARRVEHDLDLRAPALGGWPLIDRPPGQAAQIMSGYVIAANTQVGYQLLSGTLQGLAAVGVLLLLLRCGLRRWHLVVANVLVLGTLFVFANTVFVWPKLFSAGLLLVALAVLMNEDGRVDRLGWAVVGALVGLSLVAHPGAAFALPALAVVLWRRHIRVFERSVFVGALAGAVVVVPWLLYRLLYDQTASVLISWHLAGAQDPWSPRGFFEVLVDQYRQLGLSGWLEQRWANARRLVGADQLGTVLTSGWGGVRRRTSDLLLTPPLWSGGLLLLAMPLVVWRGLVRPIVTTGLGGLAALALWLIVEFGPPIAPAVTHHGPYAAFLLISVALAATLAKIAARWVLVVTLGVQLVLALWLAYPMGADDRCHVTKTCPPPSYPLDTSRPDLVVVPVALAGALGAAVFVSSTRVIGGPSTAPPAAQGLARCSSASRSTIR